MANVKPGNFILRCYGRKTEKGNWFGLCLDFNLAVEAESPELLKKKMNEVIISYIETVFDTDDKRSIPQLFSRRAPFRDWLVYYIIKSIIFIKQFPDRFIFNEIIPFHLAHSC